jgi:uncharacterized surface protein with fasciclin (FAS1) repeats
VDTPPVKRASRVALVAVAAVLLGAACSEEDAAPGAPSAPTPTPPAVVPSASPDPDDGLALVGPGCAALRAVLPATADDVAEPLMATAATLPQLQTFRTAVAAVPGLADTLDASTDLTVYAPTDAAFERLHAELGDAAYTALLEDPQRLAPLLAYHVAATRSSAEELVAAGKSTQLVLGSVAVGGTAGAPTFTGGAGGTANLVCGDIPTANAMLFVVDAVLMPAP